MSHPTEPRGALTGMRVLDMTQILAGPFCTMQLADLGAEVIKVENPDGGDQTRRSWGSSGEGEDSRAFLAINRNKKSIRVDLRSEEGRAQFLLLAETADVIVESWRPGVAARLGVDYETISRINPAIVYASISGFGQDGPYSRRPGYDLIAQGMGGLMSISAGPDGSPSKSALPIGDLGAGLLCLSGILAAYIERLSSGKGQYLETSLFDAIVAFSVWESTEYWGTGVPPAPTGSAHRMNAPYQALRTRDGYITVGANSHKLWERLCEAIGASSLIDDERFATNEARVSHRVELAAVLETYLAEAGTDEWVDTILAAGVPAGPIRNYQQVLDDDPQVQARGLVQIMQHPVEGAVKVLGPPVKFSRTPAVMRSAAPLLGQHDDEYLTPMPGGPEPARPGPSDLQTPLVDQQLEREESK